MDGVVGSSDTQQGVRSLRGRGATFAPGPADVPGREENVSVAGVLLLSAMSMLMAIMGMVTFALVVIGCWWVIRHIPVPIAVHNVLAQLHLAHR